MRYLVPFILDVKSHTKKVTLDVIILYIQTVQYLEEGALQMNLKRSGLI